MANADNNYGSADFFELPKEMRDAIYSNLTQDVVLASGMPGTNERQLQIIVKNAPIPKLARLNKQFKEEYERQTRSRRILAIKDLGGSLSDLSALPDRKPIPTFENIVCDLLTICVTESCTTNQCDAVMDISTHIEMLNDLDDILLRSNSADLTARLYVHWKDGSELKWERVDHGADFVEKMNKFVEVKGLSRLEVYPFYWKDEYECVQMVSKIYEKHEKLVALWMKEHGWVAL